MKNNVQEIEARPLTKLESDWILEILGTKGEWSGADIKQTKVVAQGPCDDGLSLILRAPDPENPKLAKEAGYVGRLVICTADDSLIEVRLSQAGGRLDELFVLFVDPKHPDRKLPESWTEISHEAIAM